MTDVHVINTIDSNEFENDVEAYIESGYTLEETSIDSNELGEPYFRAVLVKKGDLE